jgi:hypothetical protein
MLVLQLKMIRTSLFVAFDTGYAGSNGLEPR